MQCAHQVLFIMFPAVFRPMSVMSLFLYIDITEAGFERWLFLNAHWTNSERYLMVHPYNKTVMFCHQDLLRLSGQQLESCELVWKIIERFQRLELLPDECNIVAAISLMTASKYISNSYSSRTYFFNYCNNLRRYMSCFTNPTHGE